jgi:hypothetical protein
MESVKDLRAVLDKGVKQFRPVLVDKPGVVQGGCK